jgi:rubrerythrin
MQGAIRKRDILAHPVTTVQCFGWEVVVRVLFAGRDETFLNIAAGNMHAPAATAELPEFIMRGRALERRAMQVYRSLAQVFVGTAPVQELFLELAYQEECHAELLELCHMAGGRGCTSEQFRPWRGVVEQLEERMESLERRAQRIMDVTEALQLVLELESSEIDDVFTAIVETSGSKFAQTIKTFRSAVQDHVALVCRTVPALAPELTERCDALRQKHQ